MSERIKAIKRVMDRFVFLFFRLVFRRRNEVSSKTIAVIRSDGIGDLVFFLPFIGELKDHFGDSRIVLICRDEAAPMAASLTDEVISYRYLRYRWNYLYRLRVLMRIRSLRPSLTLYVSYHRQHIGDEMAILSGAEKVVAFGGNDEIIHPSMRKVNDRYYTDIVDVDDHSPEWKKYRSLFERLGVKNGGGGAKRKGIFDVKEGPGREEYIILTPGGSSLLRRWPWERFAELGDKLAGQTGMSIILCGNQDEKGILRRIAGKMATPPKIAAELQIQEVVDLIKRAKIVVGNESGLAHVAASVGTPAVVILGGGHFSRYFPYGSAKIVNHKLDCYECNWRCPFPEPYCLTMISVEDVMRVVQEVKSKA